MNRIKHIVAPVASAVAMALLTFAPSANAQNDRIALAYDPLGATGWSAPDLKHRPDPVAESFFRMLTYTPAVKSDPITPPTGSDPLREAVVRALWNSGDRAARYHVELAYPEAGSATLAVDASTLKISASAQSLQPPGWPTLPTAAAVAAAGVGGPVIVATLDSVDGADPHYDIYVRLPTDDIAQLRFDPSSRQFRSRTSPDAD